MRTNTKNITLTKKIYTGLLIATFIIVASFRISNIKPIPFEKLKVEMQKIKEDNNTTTQNNEILYFLGGMVIGKLL